MNVSRKQVQIICALFLLGLSLTACSNTFHGAGEDIENAGEAVQDAAD